MTTTPDPTRAPVRIAISMGDANGVGPEVIIKALSSSDIDLNSSVPIIIGQEQVFEHYEELLAINLPTHPYKPDAELQPGRIYLSEAGEQGIEITPGHIKADAGKLSMDAVATAISYCLNDQADALVTAPISKEAVNQAGYEIPGHTEYLAEKTSTDLPLMMMVGSRLNIALVTTHIPVQHISRFLSKDYISRIIRILDSTLKHTFRISDPHIAILGLNPHAGDGGIIGNEETDIIIPAINENREQGLHLDGPFPADGFFARKSYENFDAVLAMYHDQGLIPFKMLCCDRGVNFTAGLPIIRTSPDHGTAYSISGLGQAEPSSFVEAYNLAVTLAKNSRD